MAGSNGYGGGLPMSSECPVISVRDLSKCYEIFETPGDRLKEFLLPRAIRALFWPGPGKGQVKRFCREFWALREISFEVRPGETIGIIGRNGSGKSTLLQILAGILAASTGEVNVRGRVAALLELGSGFNPEFTGRENVFLSGQILGLTRGQISERFEAIAEFADIGDFIEQPVKTYSSGMFVRLAFAVHAHIDASIVIIDEALAVGDIFFRQKCYQRLEMLRRQGAAIILVSHSMPDIEQYCERAIVLDKGRVHFSGNASEAARHYYLLHQPSLDVAAPCGAGDGLRKDADGTPPEELGFPLSPRWIAEDKTQIGNGGARCVSLTVCNAEHQESHAYRQGDMASFFYEFELMAPMDGVPVVGVLIKNERGVIVHGKNSWQFSCPVPAPLQKGDRILCRQELELALGPGEYVYEVGLSMVPATLWDRRESISHDEMSASESRICHVGDAGMLSIALSMVSEVPKLTHHGVANLRGALQVGLLRPESLLEQAQPRPESTA